MRPRTDQGHAEQRHQPFRLGDGPAPVARVGAHVRHDDRCRRPGDLADHAFAQRERDGRVRLDAGVVGRAEHEALASLFQQVQGDRLGSHHPGGHLGHDLEHLVQIERRDDRAADLEEPFQLVDLLAHVVVEGGLLERPGSEVADEREQLDLVVGEVVRMNRLHVHRADGPALHGERDGEQGGQCLLERLGQQLEPRIGSRVGRSDRSAVKDGPPGQALAGSERRHADGRPGEASGGLEDKPVALLQVDRARGHVHDLGGDSGDDLEGGFQLPG